MKPDKKDIGVLRPPTASLLPIVALTEIRRFRLGAAYTKLTSLFVAREEQKRESAIA
jgi:hypothetical protein